MVPVVGGHVTREVCDGDPASFGMKAAALPFLPRELVEHTKIGFSKLTEHLPSFARRPRFVIAEPGPFVLVKARKSRAAILDHLAITPAADKFILGHVGENGRDRPLARRGPVAQQ